MKRTLIFLFGLFAGIYLIGCSSPTPEVTLEKEAEAPAAEPQEIEEAVSLITTGTYTATIQHDGLERSYLFHVPDQANLDEPLPLLLNLHGMTGTSESQLTMPIFGRLQIEKGSFLSTLRGRF